MPRTLIICQCFLKNDWHGRLLRTMMALTRRLNPDVDIILIDNASLLSPLSFLGLKPGEVPSAHLTADGTQWGGIMEPAPFKIASFGSSIGHFYYDRHNAVPPKDGPGRAIMTGLRIAAASGYERAAYMETDALVSLPLSWGFDRMTAKTACLPRIPYGYLDNQVWWIADVQWLVNDFDLPGKYDWPNRKADWQGDRCGELIYEDILGEHYEPLPMRAGRGDAIKLQDGTMRERFEEVRDCITHTSPADFATWLELNGHADLVPGLLSGDR